MPLSSVLGAQSLVRPGVCTSSTRPASPFEGQVIYETDTDRALAWDGSAWDVLSDMGAWTSYTPTLTAATTNPNIGSTGAVTGKYVQIGRIVHVRAKFSFGGTGVSAGSGGYQLTIPVTAAESGHVAGIAFGQDASAQARQVFSVWLDTSTKIAFFYNGASGFPTLGASAPWTWAADDFLSCFLTYEAA